MANNHGKQTNPAGVILKIALAIFCILGTHYEITSAQTAPIVPVVRDWKTFPAIEQLQTTQDVYQVADLHGDYDKALKLFAGAGIIPAAPALPQDVKWAAGKSVLVCTGDMIDKWNQGLEIIRLMRALQIDAQKQGGQMIVCLGNHEAELLAAGGLNKKGNEFEQELIANGIKPEDVAAGRDAEGLGDWLRTRPVAAKVNDWFFCHAGNTFGMTVKQIEDAVEQGVNKEGFGASVLAEPNSILESRMAPVPWWTLVATPATQRSGANPTSGNAGLDRLRGYLAALGCNHLMIGHAPGAFRLDATTQRKAGQPFTYQGVIFFSDTGMSRGAADGQGAVFKIHFGTKETVTVINSSGTSSDLWMAR